LYIYSYSASAVRSTTSILGKIRGLEDEEVSSRAGTTAQQKMIRFHGFSDDEYHRDKDDCEYVRIHFLHQDYSFRTFLSSKTENVEGNVGKLRTKFAPHRTKHEIITTINSYRANIFGNC
jgi:hypothetical protein